MVPERVALGVEQELLQQVVPSRQLGQGEELLLLGAGPLVDWQQELGADWLLEEELLADWMQEVELQADWQAHLWPDWPVYRQVS